MVKNIKLLQGLHFNNFKIVLRIMTWRRFLRGNYLQKKQVCNLSVKRLLQNCFARVSIASSCHDTWTMLRRSVAGTPDLLDHRPSHSLLSHVGSSVPQTLEDLD